MTTQLTFGTPTFGFVVGDRVTISDDTNRMRRRVQEVPNNSTRPLRFTRPSRGFARHVRRSKQAKRRERP